MRIAPGSARQSLRQATTDSSGRVARPSQPAGLLAYSDIRYCTSRSIAEIWTGFVRVIKLDINLGYLCSPAAVFQSARRSRLDGRPVVRSPKQLRLHPALDELDWVGVIGELNEAVRLTNSSVTEPILITTNGTILAGISRWRTAVHDGRPEINCIEYPLSEDEALEFIIGHHQPQRGWNAFIRIRLALKLEPYFQQRALDNMRAGGKYKGSAKLPEAEHIDVRQEIARAAGVGARNVSNVRTIL
jgi:hypothetical protein